jgi:hypothetical protein
MGAGVALGVSNIGTNCPVCGFGGAKVSDGVYRATQDAIELISGPDSTHEILEVLKTLAERLSSGEIDRAQAIRQAHDLSPKYAALFETFIKLGLPALALLIAMIGVYLQHEGNKSSSEDAKKIFDAVTEQTFAIKEIDRRGGVDKKSYTPSRKKTKAETVSVKDPSSRRTHVNRERRESLKKCREAFGQSRTR